MQKIIKYIVKFIKTNTYFNLFNLNKERKITTHLTDEEKIALNELAKSINKKGPVAVEIGSYLGSSSCFIANGFYNKQGIIYCIDTWNNDAMTEGNRDTFKEFSENTKKYSTNIKPVRGWSYEVIEEIKALNTHFDLLFIDGDHSYEGCKTDWDLYSPLLTTHSIVVFHDTSWAEGVNKVIKTHVANIADQIISLPNLQAFRLR